jgi:hypothetical protein
MQKTNIRLRRSIKLSDQLYELLANNAERTHRSLAAQNEYWATLGMLIEKKLSGIEIENLFIEFNSKGKIKK